MKTETLLLIAGPAAVLLWLMDQQSAAAPVSVPPAATSVPTQTPVAPIQAPASPQPAAPASPSPIIETQYDPSLPVMKRSVRTFSEAIPPPPVNVTQRNPRTTTVVSSLSGLPMYGGWGRE
jgi:hypothetical protein